MIDRVLRIFGVGDMQVPPSKPAAIAAAPKTRKPVEVFSVSGVKSRPDLTGKMIAMDSPSPIQVGNIPARLDRITADASDPNVLAFDDSIDSEAFWAEFDRQWEEKRMECERRLHWPYACDDVASCDHDEAGDDHAND